MSLRTAYVYAGSYTRLGLYPRGKGSDVSVRRLGPTGGALGPIQTVGGVLNPTFLALSPSGRNRYAISAVREVD